MYVQNGTYLPNVSFQPVDCSPKWWTLIACIHVDFLIYRFILLRFGQFKDLDNNSFECFLFSIFSFLHYRLFETDTWNCEQKKFSLSFASLPHHLRSSVRSSFQVANSKNALNVPFIFSFLLVRRLLSFFPYFIARVHRLKIIIGFNLNGELPTRFIFFSKIHDYTTSRFYMCMTIKWSVKNCIRSGKVMVFLCIYLLYG